MSKTKNSERNNLLFIIEEDNQLKVGKKIKLEEKRIYYKFIIAVNNTIALLSFSKIEEKSYLELFDYKNKKNN